jgi:hypothetical protein
LAPTAPGCEDLYVGMTLCWGDLLASQWECSDQGADVVWPAPVPGTVCEILTCSWHCCELSHGGVLWDVNFVGTRCNYCP